MDASPLYPVPFHPSKPTRRRDWKGEVRPLTRTERPVKYYIIDYGISQRFAPEDDARLIFPIVGGDKSVPEHQDARVYEMSDPFATDIYTAGNLVNVWFVKVCRAIHPYECNSQNYSVLKDTSSCGLWCLT